MRNDEEVAPPAASDDAYPWLREGSMPRSREELVAEVLAMVALTFSVGFGLLIALLPVSSQPPLAGPTVARVAAIVAPSSGRTSAAAFEAP
jgi:hypothetical protein